MLTLPETLREYVRSKSSELGIKLDALWLKAGPIHERQNRPDSNENGRRHIEMVEKNAWRLLTETRRPTGELNSDLLKPGELFLLAAAVCTHDFDKALKSAQPLPSPFQHGEGSGEFVVKNAEVLGLAKQEAKAIKAAVSLHDLKTGPFESGLAKLRRDESTPFGPIDLQRIATLLKAADVLQCDYSRILSIGTDHSALTGLDRVKYLARNCTSGWKADGTRIVLQAEADTQEEANAFHSAFEFMRSKEWATVRDSLQKLGFPFELDLDYRGPDPTPISSMPPPREPDPIPKSATLVATAVTPMEKFYEERTRAVVAEKTAELLQKQIDTLRQENTSLQKDREAKAVEIARLQERVRNVKTDKSEPGVNRVAVAIMPVVIASLREHGKPSSELTALVSKGNLKPLVRALERQQKGDDAASPAATSRTRALTAVRYLLGEFMTLGQDQYIQGDLSAAEITFNTILELAGDDRFARGAALNKLGDIADSRGEYGLAESLYQEVLKGARATGRDQNIALATGRLGNVAMHYGNLDRAEELHNQALNIHLTIGSRLGEADALCGLGNVEMARDNLDRAEELYSRSLNANLTIGNKRGEAGALGNLANVSRRRGDLDRAKVLFTESLALERACKHKYGEAVTICNLGLLLQERKTSGAHLFTQARTLFEQMGHREGIACQIAFLGLDSWQQENLPLARQLLMAALAAFKGMRMTLRAIKVERWLEQLDVGRPLPPVKDWMF